VGIRGGLWLLTLAASIAASLTYWWAVGRPQPVVDAPAGKIACVSYTPFRGAETPFDPTLMVPPERIEEDLARLAPVVGCVRTYATDQGLQAVPEIAARHGMQVLLGIWIGREAPANRQQIETAVALARAYPDAIRAIIVGNEVLLRGEQSGATLASFLREVKERTGKPVTYADVWEFWLRAPPELAAAADFITVHVLPYWEDDPVAAEAGVAHLRSVLAKVDAAFPGKPVLVGETGWPSAGRERRAALPGRLEQARYLRGFLDYAAAAGLDYNLIEAFDQPWKRVLEGTVGGHWGLFDEAREAKLALAGPVSDDPFWREAAIASLLVGLLLLGARARSLRAATPLRAALLPPIAFAGATLLVVAARHSWLAQRNPAELVVEAALLALSAMIAWELLGRAAGTGPAARDLAIAELAATPGRIGRVLVDPSQRLDLLRILAVAGALAASLALLFDPRYRDFPIAAFALPAIGLALEASFRRDWLQGRTDRCEEAIFAALLLVSAVGILIQEGLANCAALAWVALVLLLALPWLGAFRGLRAGADAPHLSAAATR